MANIGPHDIRGRKSLILTLCLNFTFPLSSIPQHCRSSLALSLRSHTFSLPHRVANLSPSQRRCSLSLSLPPPPLSPSSPPSTSSSLTFPRRRHFSSSSMLLCFIVVSFHLCRCFFTSLSPVLKSVDLPKHTVLRCSSTQGLSSLIFHFLFPSNAKALISIVVLRLSSSISLYLAEITDRTKPK